MFSTPVAVIAAIALQSAAADPAPDASEPTTLDAFSVESSTAPRCGIAFAVVSRWQKSGWPRADEYPDMDKEGGREFFVQAMNDLMERESLSEAQLATVVGNEVERLDSPEGVERIDALMPECLRLKQAAGL